MDLRFTAEEEAFRQEIRDFVKAELPPAMERPVIHGGETVEEWDFVKKFTRKLGEKGWIAIWWPREYGGLEGTDIQYLIFNEEMVLMNCKHCGSSDLTVIKGFAEKYISENLKENTQEI